MHTIYSNENLGTVLFPNNMFTDGGCHVRKYLEWWLCSYRVVLINVTDALPQEAWKVLVPQDPDLMLSAISQSFTVGFEILPPGK